MRIVYFQVYLFFSTVFPDYFKHRFLHNLQPLNCNMTFSYEFTADNVADCRAAFIISIGLRIEVDIIKENRIIS